MARSELHRGVLMALRAIALVIVGMGAAACRVDVPDDAVFSCASDDDCGGDGYLCAPREGTTGVCCLPTEESCNGLDDDCDGELDDGIAAVSCYTGPEGTAGVGACAEGTRPCESGAFVQACVGEVKPAAEQCNGADDDCDGEVDEGFDFATDRDNCGACAQACSESEQCVAGACVGSAESSCSDGTDNDVNGLTDCADPQCDGRPCGTGCRCEGTSRVEQTCSDGQDNDGDSTVDCADPDCVGRTCQPAPSTFTCDAQQQCTCNGASATPEVGAACSNGQDDDCDGQIDCADPDCALESCGAGCVCRSGGEAEADCADRADNDGDALVDCADVVDCPQGAACTFLQGNKVTNGTCRPNQTCK